MREENNSVVLQAFETQLSADGSLWRTIGEMAKSFASLVISALWVPLAWKGAGEMVQMATIIETKRLDLNANYIKIKKLPVKSFISGFTGETNCLVIRKKGLAVVVDPGGEGEKISRFIKCNKLKVGAYWLTHEGDSK